MNRQKIGDIADLLLGYVENKTTFRGDKVVSVPAGSYLDPNAAQAERELIFKRYH